MGKFNQVKRKIFLQTSYTSPSPETITIPYHSLKDTVLTTSLACPAYSTTDTVTRTFKRVFTSVTHKVYKVNKSNQKIHRKIFVWKFSTLCGTLPSSFYHYLPAIVFVHSYLIYLPDTYPLESY